MPETLSQWAVALIFVSITMGITGLLLWLPWIVLSFAGLGIVVGLIMLGSDYVHRV